MTPKGLVGLAPLCLSSLPLHAQDNGLRTIPASQDAPTTLTKLDQAIKFRG